MQVIRGYQGLAPEMRGATAALGNFDGVHVGHRSLIATARAAAPDAPLGIVTFEPHPRRHFQPAAPAFRLTLPDEQARILGGLGIDLLFRLDFDAALAGMSAEGFAADVLGRGLGLCHVVIGEDFRFGKGRRGDAVMLRRLGLEHGFGATLCHLAGDENGPFSSTGVRALIEQGRMAEAGAALGRWHSVAGPVIRGERRGRTLGYPTANLDLGDQLMPRHGVYAARVDVLDGPHAGLHPGVASIGVRPQFGENAPNFEVHLFDFSGDLYGVPVSVALIEHLRDEARFDSVTALVAQMDEDSARARAVLAEAAETPA